MDPGSIIADSSCLDFLVFVQRHQSGKSAEVSFGDLFYFVGDFYFGFYSWVLA